MKILFTNCIIFHCPNLKCPSPPFSYSILLMCQHDLLTLRRNGSVALFGLSLQGRGATQTVYLIRRRTLTYKSEEGVNCLLNSSTIDLCESPVMIFVDHRPSIYEYQANSFTLCQFLHFVKIAFIIKKISEQI